MFKKKVLLFFISFIFPLLCSAEELFIPQEMIGGTVDDIFSFGRVPDEIYPNRGVEADEDNVVFFYDGGFYLYLFKNRVWQVRCDRNFDGSVLGLNMGDSRDHILSVKLQSGLVPFLSDEDSLTFLLSQGSYPVRMTLYFVNEILDDLYIYRADF